MAIEDEPPRGCPKPHRGGVTWPRCAGPVICGIRTLQNGSPTGILVFAGGSLDSPQRVEALVVPEGQWQAIGYRIG